MKAALLYAKEDLRIVDIDKPKTGPGDVLVKVRVCAVCPTDIRKYRVGNHGVPSYPFNMGHEWAGDIVEVGKNIKSFKRGMRVAGQTYRGYAEYVRVTEDELREYSECMIMEIPDAVSYEEATFMEPLADCLHALLDQGKMKMGDTVVIIGAGQMGLQQLMVAKIGGAKVIVSELHHKRLELAKQFGADCTVNPSKEDPVKFVKKVTNDKGADVVIVSVGQPTAILQGLQMARQRGRVVLFGGAPRGTTVQLDPNIIHYNEIVLTGCEWVGASPEYFNVKLFEMALDLIRTQKVPVRKLITHRFPLEDILKAFEVTEKQEGLKAIITI